MNIRALIIVFAVIMSGCSTTTPKIIDFDVMIDEDGNVVLPDEDDVVQEEDIMEHKE